MLQGLINWLAKFVNTDHWYNITADTVHEHIHDGDHYNASYLVAAVANNGNADIRFTTGAKSCHMNAVMTASGKSQFFIYEAPTVSVGTAITIYNNKRSSTNTPTAAVKHTPTVTAAGTTLLINGLINGGTGGVSQGGSGGNRNEIVFKPSTEYLIRLTNTAGTAQDLNILLEWYEH